MPDRVRSEYGMGPDRPRLRDSEWSDIHVITAVLKFYLRTLPDSVIQASAYAAFGAAANPQLALDPPARMESMRLALQLLRPTHRATLGVLVRHLHRCVA